MKCGECEYFERIGCPIASRYEDGCCKSDTVCEPMRRWREAEEILNGIKKICNQHRTDMRESSDILTLGDLAVDDIEDLLKQKQEAGK